MLPWKNLSVSDANAFEKKISDATAALNNLIFDAVGRGFVVGVDLHVVSNMSGDTPQVVVTPAIKPSLIEV